MSKRAPTPGDDEASAPLSRDGQAALARALSAHARQAGPQSQERAALALGDALSRERRVTALLSRPDRRGPLRLSASVEGDAEVLLRTLADGGFLLCSEGERLWVEWRGRGTPTLSVSRGWTAEPQPRRRGAPLRWTLRRTGRAARGLASVSAVVAGRRWTLWRAP